MSTVPTLPTETAGSTTAPVKTTSRVDRFLSNMNDWHLPFGWFVFASGALMQLTKHLDATFVTFSTSILTFVGTHAYFQGKNGGNDSQ